MSRSRRAAAADPLDAFAPATRDWFRSSFEAPTEAQSQGWPAIAAGDHTLICAPTGSGKTLAAFLWCLDRLRIEETPTELSERLRTSTRFHARSAEQEVHQPEISRLLRVAQRIYGVSGRAACERNVRSHDVRVRATVALRLLAQLRRKLLSLRLATRADKKARRRQPHGFAGTGTECLLCRSDRAVPRPLRE